MISMDSQPPVPPEARLTLAVETWKRKLLDLTKRNRALHFRPTRVSTVTIVDEQPAEVFRHLYMREKPMRFRAAPEKAEAGKPPETPASPPGADDGPALDFVPYEPASLDERHTDDWLQTTSSPEALDKSLRRLDEQARLSLEEQGVNTLFLALGMLHYTEADDSSQVFRAPLLLLPVELTRKSARSGYAARVTDDDPLVNPALVEYLRRAFRINLPELPDSSAIPEDYDLQSFLKAASEAISPQKGWSIKTDIHLALFSFQKFVMYKDLEAHGEAVRQHRILRQLVTREGEVPEGSMRALPDEIRSLELDRDYPPETTFQVVDADASQLRVIAASSRDYDLVIEGPPGTGKSQTITNLIAQALSAGKSVLFVAEKMAALQVVHSRLSQVGLGEFCLELHSTKASKREVMQGLAAAVDASLRRIAAPAASTQRLPQVRVTLSEYVEAVHTPYGALGLSPYQAYGELGKVLGARRWVWAGPAAAEIGREEPRRGGTAAPGSRGGGRGGRDSRLAPLARHHADVLLPARSGDRAGRRRGARPPSGGRPPPRRNGGGELRAAAGRNLSKRPDSGGDRRPPRALIRRSAGGPHRRLLERAAARDDRPDRAGPGAADARGHRRRAIHAGRAGAGATRRTSSTSSASPRGSSASSPSWIPAIAPSGNAGGATGSPPTRDR